MNKERKLIIAGNWKMNKTVAEALALVNDLKRDLASVKEVDIVVCPPYTALESVSKAVLDSNIKLGAYVYVPVWRSGEVTGWATGWIAEPGYDPDDPAWIVRYQGQPGGQTPPDALFFPYSIQCGVCMGRDDVSCYQCQPARPGVSLVKRPA